MTLPTFLIIGAMKAGTTALYHYLGQHPQVYMSPVKEPHFFAFEGQIVRFAGPRDQIIMDDMVRTEFGAYEALFAAGGSHRARGEASAMYLYYPEAAYRIRHYLPDVRLIVMLRHPAERAYSSYLHLVRDGREKLDDFAEALAQEPQRMADNWVPIWHYIHAGFYHRQLQAYFACFHREQIRVYLHDDLVHNPMAVMKDAFQFVGVDADYQPDFSVKHNVSGVPKNRVLQRLDIFMSNRHPIKERIKPLIPAQLRQQIVQRTVSQIRRHNLKKPSMPPGPFEQLIDIYREDILNLQGLIGRDLSAWLEVPDGTVAR